MRKLIWAAALGISTFSLCGSAQAQEQDTATRAAARGLGVSGVENYQAGRYDQASDELEKAYGILRVPSLALWSARALAKRGLLVEAAERYLEATALQAPIGDAAVHKQAIADATSELAALKPRIPRLQIRLVGAHPSEVVVTIDGKTVASALLDTPRLVNPGTYEVVAAYGSERAAAKATLSEGQKRELTLQLGRQSDAAASPPPAAPAAIAAATSPPAGKSPAASQSSAASGTSRRTLAIVALAAGGAGLVLGGVAGGLAYSKKTELDDTGKCTNGCPSSLAEDVDQLHLYRPLSTAGFIAGGVLTGLGVVLWVTAPTKGGAETRAQLTPNGVLLAGRF